MSGYGRLRAGKGQGPPERTLKGGSVLGRLRLKSELPSILCGREISNLRKGGEIDSALREVRSTARGIAGAGSTAVVLLDDLPPRCGVRTPSVQAHLERLEVELREIEHDRERIQDHLGRSWEDRLNDCKRDIADAEARLRELLAAV